MPEHTVSCPLPFRALVSLDSGSRVLAERVSEGAALDAALQEFARVAAEGGSADELPAKNRHGSRRWMLHGHLGQQLGAVYVEPVGSADNLAAEWLEVAGYPTVAGWWIDRGDGVPVLAVR